MKTHPTGREAEAVRGLSDRSRRRESSAASVADTKDRGKSVEEKGTRTETRKTEKEGEEKSIEVGLAKSSTDRPSRKLRAKTTEKVEQLPMAAPGEKNKNKTK